MVKAKFQNMLQEKVRKDKEFEEQQENLKKKHHIQRKNVVVVEKSNMIKFLLKLLIGLLRFGATAVLLGFAVIGITAMVYPEPRYIMIGIGRDVLFQLMDYLNL